MSRGRFLEGQTWEMVVSLNERACQRTQTQHGYNSETYRWVEQSWRQLTFSTLTLGEAIAFLKDCQRHSPFLFHNGSTFAEIGRWIAVAHFADLAPIRRREIASAVEQHISGTLDEDWMTEIIVGLATTVPLRPGDRVRTLRGSIRGVILNVFADGRVLWRPIGTAAALTALPETLLLEQKQRRSVR